MPLFAKCIRNIPNEENAVFLTFDDGPDPRLTPALLEILEDFDAVATFFVIGEKAVRYPAIIEMMEERGHAIGNHSWDHRYRYFFRSKSALRGWVENSEARLTECLQLPSVAFRSPAGVKTPPLQQVLGELEIPWVHWNRRYFDTVYPFTPKRAMAAAKKIQSGDIILLHDGHCPNPEIFLEAIRVLVEAAATRGLVFRPIPRRETLLTKMV